MLSQVAAVTMLHFACLRLFLTRTRRHISFHLTQEVLFAPVAMDTLKVQRPPVSIHFRKRRQKFPRQDTSCWRFAQPRGNLRSMKAIEVCGSVRKIGDAA